MYAIRSYYDMQIYSKILFHYPLYNKQKENDLNISRSFSFTNHLLLKFICPTGASIYYSLRVGLLNFLIVH